MCGESVLVAVQHPAKIAAVDVVRAPQRGWRMAYFCTLVEMCPSICCCDCGWHVREYTGGQKDLWCFHFSCLLVSKREAGGKLKPVVSHLLSGESFMVFGFLIRLRIFPSTN